MLVNAVVTETASVIFDLSPGNFLSKVSSEDIKLTLHMVFKVSVRTLHVRIANSFT
jgi:hypothetical protein